MSGVIAAAVHAIICIFLGVNGAFAQGDGADKLPMFGQPKMARPENLKKADDDFIRDSTLRHGNRVAGSNTTNLAPFRSPGKPADVQVNPVQL